MASFPNVPIAPGVPPVPRNPLNPVVGAVLLTADAVLSLVHQFTISWGVFSSGVPIIVPDSVVTVAFDRGWGVPDYPVEQGGFQSYNKVQRPFEAQVRMSKGGSPAERGSFLTQLDAIAGSLIPYDVVTPDRVYSNATITRYKYDRAANAGLGLLVTDIWLKEIRATATVTGFTNTQDPGSQASQSAGQTTPVPATSAQQATAPLAQ